LREIARAAVLAHEAGADMHPGRLIIKGAYFPSLAHVRAFAQYSDVLVVKTSRSLIDFAMRENNPESLALFPYMSASYVLRNMSNTCCDRPHEIRVCQALCEAVSDIVSHAPLKSYKFAVIVALRLDDPRCMQLVLDMPGVTVNDAQWCASLMFYAGNGRLLDLAVRMLTDKFGALPLFDDSPEDDLMWRCAMRPFVINLRDVLTVARYYAGADWGKWARDRHNLVLDDEHEAENEALICEIARIHPRATVPRGNAAPEGCVPSESPYVDILSSVLSDPSVVPELHARELCAKWVERAREQSHA
jgi:hypothetical protein